MGHKYKHEFKIVINKISKVKQSNINKSKIIKKGAL